MKRTTYLTSIFVVIFMLMAFFDLPAETQCSFVLIAEKDGKCRVYNSNGSLVSNAYFSRASGSSGGKLTRQEILLISRDSKWGLMSLEDGKLSEELVYKTGYVTGGYFFLMSEDQKWSVFNSKAVLVGSYCCDFLSIATYSTDSSQLKFLFRKGKTYGILDMNFEPLYETECKRLRVLRNGMTLKQVGDSTIILGRDFEALSEKVYDSVSVISNPRGVFRQQYSKNASEWSYVDFYTEDGIAPYIVIGKRDGLDVLLTDTGKEKCIADSIHYLGRGFFKIRNGNASEITNLKGFSKTFESRIYTKNFANGLLPFSKNRVQWGYMNSKLEIVISPVYNKAGMHVIGAEGYAIVKFGKRYFLIDGNGNNVTGKQYRELKCQYFGEMPIVFTTKTEIGLMNNKGKTAFALDSDNYKKVYYPKAGKCLVRGNEHFELIDLKSGKMMPIEADAAVMTNQIMEIEGYILSKKNAVGFIDSQGNEVLPYIFDAVYPIFQEIGEAH